VRIYAPTAAATAEALRRVRLVTLERRWARSSGRGDPLVRDFFAIVKLAPNVEARLPIAEDRDDHRIGQGSGRAQAGRHDAGVAVLGFDAQSTKILASRKAAKDADESDAVI